MIDAKEFRESIRNVVPAQNAEHFYFSQTATAYYADFRPAYPEKTAGDFLIVYEILTEKITMRTDTFAIPTIVQYKTFDELLEQLHTMEKAPKKQKTTVYIQEL